MAIHLGCAVWAFPGWVGDLFPAGSRPADFLRLYSRRLTAVEGNTTFYATPSPATVARWAAETPESFRFCFKLPREVSHAGPLADKLPLAHDFLARLAPLGPRLGPLLLQLPPGYAPTRLPDLGRFLAGWPPGVALSVEVRHPAWYEPAGERPLMDLLRGAGAGRVVMDVRPIRDPADPGGGPVDAARQRKPDVPLRPLRGGGPALVRYIGHPELARNAAMLDEWADRLAGWHAAGTEIYLFMHCPDEARSPALCGAIAARLAARGAMPPLAWAAADEPPPAPTQLGLFE